MPTTPGTIITAESTGPGRQVFHNLPVAVSNAQFVSSYLQDKLLSIGTLLITAAAEKFKTTTTAYFRIKGIQFSKTATDNLTFGTAYTVNGLGGAGTAHWGSFRIQVDAAGTVTGLAVSADQDYATRALAEAALPAAADGQVSLGHITVQAKTGGLTWTADTDDMTAASDCTAAYFVDATIPTIPGAG